MNCWIRCADLDGEVEEVLVRQVRIESYGGAVAEVAMESILILIEGEQECLLGPAHVQSGSQVFECLEHGLLVESELSTLTADLAINGDVDRVAGVTCQGLAIAKRDFVAFEIPGIPEVECQDGARELVGAAISDQRGAEGEHGQALSERKWNRAAIAVDEKKGLAATIAKRPLLLFNSLHQLADLADLIDDHGDATEMIAGGLVDGLRSACGTYGRHVDSAS